MNHTIIKLTYLAYCAGNHTRVPFAFFSKRAHYCLYSDRQTDTRGHYFYTIITNDMHGDVYFYVTPTNYELYVIPEYTEPGHSYRSQIKHTGIYHKIIKRHIHQLYKALTELHKQVRSDVAILSIPYIARKAWYNHSKRNRLLGSR